jgi:hypothetical protein
MLESERNLNAFLQVTTAIMRDSSTFDRDLQIRAHATIFASLPGIRRRLPGIRRRLPGIRQILLSLDDDHVKLRLELPCTDVDVSRFIRNFPARAQSR